GDNVRGGGSRGGTGSRGIDGGGGGGSVTAADNRRYYSFLEWQRLDTLMSNERDRGDLARDLTRWYRQELSDLPWEGTLESFTACAHKAETLLKDHGLSIRGDIDRWYGRSQPRSQEFVSKLP